MLQFIIALATVFLGCRIYCNQFRFVKRRISENMDNLELEPHDNIDEDDDDVDGDVDVDAEVSIDTVDRIGDDRLTSTTFREDFSSFSQSSSSINFAVVFSL